MYNYKNRGPFPPGKLNFHHKTSWPQTKKSILDHVIIRDNAVPPEVAAVTAPRTIQSLVRSPTDSSTDLNIAFRRIVLRIDVSLCGK